MNVQLEGNFIMNFTVNFVIYYDIRQQNKQGIACIECVLNVHEKLCSAI